MKVFAVDGVRVGLSDKGDGNMKVSGGDASLAEVNRRRFLRGVGVESAYFVRVDYDTEDFCQFGVAGKENGLELGDEAKRCDGLLTRERGVGLFLPLGDCLGLVLYDRRAEAMMVVHCGRHTLAQDGAFEAVKFMCDAVGTGAENVVAWMSPSAGGDSYPVHDLGGVSLREAVVEQLARAGVDEAGISGSEIDTTVDEHYFSHSQGDRDERFAIVAVID